MRRLVIDPAAVDDTSVAQAAAALVRGGIVACATDTLYGLAVDPTNRHAVARLFAAKGRAGGEAIPVVARDLAQVVDWCGRLPEWAGCLGREFWPGPLSVLLPVPPSFAPEVHAGTGLVAIRVPAHAVARALARLADRPVTATSANLSGHPPATTADEVEAALGASIDLILDSGPASGGPPSTIVGATGGHVRLVREGAVPWARVLRSLDAR
jgi:L-threonylcarbamoyladenylate synthase